MRRAGVALEDAVITACKLRLRPVLLTAGTTVLGLVPLTFGFSIDFANLTLSSGGQQAAFWKSMAVALMFGLSFATLLTLIVVPVLYSAAESWLERRRGASISIPAGAEPVAK
jgi:multidrug efflux pump subunit AcrB